VAIAPNAISKTFKQMRQPRSTAVLQIAELGSQSNNGDEMKNRLYVMIGMLCMAFLIVGTVQATSQTVMVKGATIGDMFSFSLAPDTVNIPLNLGVNTVSGNAVSIGGNGAWTLKAKDSMNGGAVKPVGTDGKMFQFKTDPAPMYASGNFGLQTPIKVGVTGGTLTPLTAADQTIKSGSQEIYTGSLNFEQTVLATDPKSIADGTWTYSIHIVYTGSSV